VKPADKGEQMKETIPKNSCQNFSRIALKGGVMIQLAKRSCAAITALSLMALGLMLAGCGGGGGLSSQTVSGNASVGAPLAGQVSLKDSASTPEVRSTVIASDGSFAIDVTGMQAPFIMEATGNAAGSSYKLHSFADGTGTANINPLSDAIVASAAGDKDASESYNHSDHDKLHRISSNLQATINTLLAKLEPLLQKYNAQNTNPITSRYISNHLGMDDLFDNVKITVNNGVLSIIYTKTGATIFTGSLADIANGVFTGGTLPPPPAVPSAPTGLAATGGNGQVTLAWAAVSNATSYNVYYATASGVTAANGTKIPATTNSCVQTGLPAAATYYYIVTALNSAGESVASTQVSAATASAPPVPTAPAAPTGVNAVGGTQQASISWAAVSGATSYNLYWSKTAGVTTATGTKISGATSTAVQTGLSDGTTYYYIVTAVNSVGESAASVQVAATTLASVPAPTAPAAPTGVSATGGANQATVSWPAVSGATSYNLYRSTTSGVSASTGTKIAGVSSPYVNTGLSAGATYYYVVTAVNSVGESLASAQASATTNAPPPAVPAAPAGMSASGGANQVSVSWSAVSGAASYNLYWSKTSGVTTATGTKITAVTSPYVQTGLTAGTAYFYIVTAVNVSGESPSSAQATATTSAPTVVIPAAPASVTATGGANQVSISWAAVPTATSYNIYYATTSGVTKANGAKITNAASPYSQTGLAAGTTYYYIVTAVNSAGEGVASAQASAATNAAPPAACGSCHAIPPATGHHDFHVNSQGISCSSCHGTGYSPTTVNAATHNNGAVNLSSSIGWNAATGTCGSPGCHGGGRSW
jgi:fibronectin type 3 domain-containing protein